MVVGEAELTANRRLHRVPVEKLAFDCGGLRCLVAQPADPQLDLLVLAKTALSADPAYGVVPKDGFGGLQLSGIPGEVRPAQPLPDPVHGL